MQLKYEHLDYQKQAIDSIVDLFQGEIMHHQDDFSLSDKRKISFLYLINWIICILV